MQSSWKNGDISLDGGWFALLYSGQKQSATYRNMMIIGHILDEDLKLIKTLPKKVTFTVAPAQE